MKLYEISWDAEYGVGRCWAGTQSDAKAALKAQREASYKELGFSPRAEINLVEVPTDKAGLLGFLNKNCTEVPNEL